MAKKYDVTGIGEILIDFAPMGRDDAGDNMFASKAGGAPVTFLAAISKYGGKTALIGKVGPDMFGEQLRKTIIDAGIDDTSLITDPEHNTTLAFVSLDESGDRSFSFYRNFNADVFISKDEIKTDLIEDSRIFHFGSLSLTSECAEEATAYALETARKAGCIITCDPNYRASLWESESSAIDKILKYIGYANIIKVSKEEAEMLSGKDTLQDCFDFFFSLGIKLVLITDGAEGAYFASKEFSGHAPSIKVQAVDTTGAGDIFFGSFISKFIKSGKELDELSYDDVLSFVSFAARNAGESTLKKGGLPSIPNINQ